jgi:two-component system chemotaxis sensor kinase CheA
MATVTDISGRGVGLDIVRNNLEQLHGVVDVNTTPKQGTTFTLSLPLTLATSHVLLMEVAGQTVAVPTNTVERILHFSPSDVGSVDGRPAVTVNGRTLPLIEMAKVLELPPTEATALPDEKVPVVILKAAEKHMAYAVSRFLSTQEVVVKHLGRQLKRVRNVAGATILGTGQVVIILNVPALMKSARIAAPLSAPTAVAAGRGIKKRVLVVDDSITTRTLEKNILENAGYQVFVAADGMEGWETIQREALDAMIFDVDMPRMNGLELTEKVRGEKQLEGLPVVLVTSLDSKEHKIRGMEAGADAYITKGSFDQRELLETIERLVG